jgi:hypothetical protein
LSSALYIYEKNFHRIAFYVGVCYALRSRASEDTKEGDSCENKGCGYAAWLYYKGPFGYLRPGYDHECDSGTIQYRGYDGAENV